MFLQLFFSAATFHSLAVFGHECTFLAVAPDYSHSLSAPAFTNIFVDEISVKTMTPIADFIFKIFSCYY